MTGAPTPAPIDALIAQMVERCNHPVALVTHDHRYAFVNAAYARLFGAVDPQLMTDRPVEAFLDPEVYRETVAPRLARALGGVDVTFDVSLPSGDAGAGERTLRVECCRFRADDHDAPYATVLGTDITDARAADRERARLEARYRALFTAMGSGVGILTAVDDGDDFVFVDFNPAAERIENIARSEVVGRRVSDVFPGVVQFGLLDVFRRVRQTGRPEVHPVTFYEDDRISGWRENRVFLLDTGEIVSVYEDLTERKQAEEALAASEARYRSLYETMADALSLHEIVYGPDGEPIDYRILDVNPQYEEIVGLPRAAVEGKRASVVYGVAPPAHLETFARVASTGNPEKLEVQFSAGTRYLDVAVFSTEAGRFATLFRDVSEIKQRERVVEAVLALYRSMAGMTSEELIEVGVEEAASICDSDVSYIHLVDPDQRSVRLQKWSRSTVGHCSAAPTKTHYSLSEAGIWADCVRRRGPVIHNDYPARPGRHGLPEGHVPISRHMSVPVFDKGRVVAIVGVGNKASDYSETDADHLSLFGASLWGIHERKKAEEALAASEARYRAAMEVVNEGLWDWNIATDVVHYSASYFRLLGYPPDGFPSNTEAFHSRVHPEDSAAVRRQIEMQLKAGHDYDCTFRMMRHDGKYAWIRARGRAIEYDGDGVPTRVIGTHTDVTEQRQMEMDLQREYEKFRSVVDSAADGVVVVDEEGLVIEWNTAVAALTGIARTDAIGRPIADISRQLEPEGVVRASPTSLFDRRAGHGDGRVSRRELVHTDGRHLTVEFHGFLIATGSGYRSGSILRDVTDQVRERHQLETLLSERETLFREMNHRVKNNLMMLSSLVQLTEEQMEGSAKLSDLHHQIDAIRALHEHLYQSKHLGVVDLGSYIATCLDGVFGATGDVDVRSEIADIPVEVNQAIPIGLIVNEIATNALKHGRVPGRRLTFVADAQIDKPNETWRFTLSNTGPPMSEDVDLTDGPTMGLRLVAALVDQLDGSLVISRAPHPVFTMTFPVWRGSPPAEAPGSRLC